VNVRLVEIQRPLGEVRKILAREKAVLNLTNLVRQLNEERNQTRERLDQLEAE